jgi:hypothetical protein
MAIKKLSKGSKIKPVPIHQLKTITTMNAD